MVIYHVFQHSKNYNAFFYYEPLLVDESEHKRN